MLHRASARPSSPPSLVCGVPTLKRLSLAAGQVLVREGDPPGAMYVIYAGRMRVYRRDLTAIDSMIDVATLGVGDVIGELAAILGQLRSATVQALEPSQVLEIPADHMANVMQQYQPLLRVVALALRERSELPDTQITELAATLGLVFPAEAETVADRDGATPNRQILAVPEYDAAVVYPKAVNCPACGARFSALNVKVQKDQPAERASDFHTTYRTAYNPYDYEVWVCPNDLYAALPGEFAELQPRERQQVAEVVEQVTAKWADGRPDFNVDRTLDLRQRSLELALALAEMRQAPRLRLAALAHRLAWCARERDNIEEENVWLAQALEHYRTGYLEADLGGAREELRVQYLCGELSLRLGDVTEALTWFAEGLRHRELEKHPTWERILREQWSVARLATGAGPENTAR
jgi:CRP-like cAMP-binding protein/uncharacterized protein (DUF2225 family)